MSGGECLHLVGEELKFKACVPRFTASFEGSLNALSGSVTVNYPGVEFRLGADPAEGAFPRFDAESQTWLSRRKNLERVAADRLLDAGFSGPDGDGQFQLRGEDRILRFYASELPELRDDWDVELGERFQYVTRDVEVIRPQVVTPGE